MKIYIQKNIKALRFKKGITQEKLAKELKVNRQNIRSWEEGYADPPLKTIVKMSKYFHISMERLITKNLFKHF